MAYIMPFTGKQREQSFVILPYFSAENTKT